MPVKSSLLSALFKRFSVNVKVLFNVNSLFILLNRLFANCERLLLNKYVMRNYLEYLSFLSEGFSYYIQKNDEKNVQMFAQAVLEIEDIIDKTSANTNPLSYKTKHVPNFDLPEDAKMYIERMKKVAEKQNTM